MKVKELKALLLNYNDDSEITITWNNGPEDYGFITSVKDIKEVDAIGYLQDVWTRSYPDDWDEEDSPPDCIEKILVIE